MMDKIRILLVDDSKIFLDIAAGFLADQDNLVVAGCAQSGKEAISLAAELHPDVILLDVNMPGLSGLETIPYLRQILPEARILMVSFQNSDVYRKAALLAGADAFIPKETLASALIPAIQQVSHKSEQFVSLQ